MQLIDTQEFYMLLYYGEFEQAQAMAKHLSFDEFWQVMIALNYEEPTILSYGYVISLLIKQETAEMHHLASRILTELLNTFEGAYASGYWHAKRAVELAPKNLNYKEQLLQFYRLPDQLLSKEEAIKLANEILILDPKNVSALGTLSK